jgi:hypothetical protein
MRKVSYLLTPGSITVSVDGKPRVISLDNDPDSLFQKVLALVKAKDDDGLYALLTEKEEKVKHYVEHGFSVKNGIVFINDEALPRVLGERLVRYTEEELPCQNLLAFWNNLKDNPSNDSKRDLFEFVEANFITLTTDGYMILYKRISEDHKDLFTGKIDNSVGQIVKVPRSEVNPDRNQTCSYGLHVCAWSYLENGPGVYGTQSYPVVEVKVNPAHVVAVPTDYKNAKMRVEQYEVLSISQGNPRTEYIVGEHGENIDDDLYIEYDEDDIEEDDPDLDEEYDDDDLDDEDEPCVDYDCNNPDCEICYGDIAYEDEDDFDDEGCSDPECDLCNGSVDESDEEDLADYVNNDLEDETRPVTKENFDWANIKTIEPTPKKKGWFSGWGFFGKKN